MKPTGRAPALQPPAQIPIPPAAGFLAPLPAPDPYPAFPALPLERARWALRIPAGMIRDPSPRFVLLVLALDADREGVAWPGVATLARETGLTRRGVQMALRQLEDGGWLLSRTGRRRSLDRRPKAPGERLCGECFFETGGLPYCAACGADGLDAKGELSAPMGELSAP